MATRSSTRKSSSTSSRSHRLGSAEQAKLVENHLALVARIAARIRMASNLPGCVSHQDLVQDGTIGLIEAARLYDPSREASFATFAWHRIRGEILDGLRRSDWIPRMLRGQARRAGVELPEMLSLEALKAADSHRALDLPYRAKVHDENGARGADWAHDRIERLYRCGLNERETEVLNVLSLVDGSQDAAAQILGCSPASISLVVCSIRKRAAAAGV